jgi:hypothetical protein
MGSFNQQNENQAGVRVSAKQCRSELPRLGPGECPGAPIGRAEMPEVKRGVGTRLSSAVNGSIPLSPHYFT